MLMDEYQKAAIEAPIGITQIGAIAGAGKTSCLTNRIANMVDHGVDPSKNLYGDIYTKSCKRNVGACDESALLYQRGKNCQSKMEHSIV